MTHGRYSRVLTTTLGELIRKHAENPDPLDLTDDLALLRALTEDYVDRYAQITDALLAWHESFESEKASPKPRHILDVADAARLLDRVGTMVKRIEDIRANNALPIKDLERIMVEVARVVKAHVKDETTMRRIQRDWLAVKL